jgi:putative ABC transport system ATP-binding protein
VTLLAFEAVTLRVTGEAHGARERVPVRDASFTIDQGEVVALAGRGRTGRNSVLRLAAGIDEPTDGTVTFDGRPLRNHRLLGKPDGIGLTLRTFERSHARTVVGHVATPLKLLGAKPDHATSRADDALAHVGASRCADFHPDALDHGEMVRVTIARAIITKPRLLLVDDPTDVPLDERDPILNLLQSIAREDGITVFFTTESTTGFAGVDRGMTIEDGTIRGDLHPTNATIHDLGSVGEAYQSGA